MIARVFEYFSGFFCASSKVAGGVRAAFRETLSATAECKGPKAFSIGPSKGHSFITRALRCIEVCFSTMSFMVGRVCTAFLALLLFAAYPTANCAVAASIVQRSGDTVVRAGKPFHAVWQVDGCNNHETCALEPDRDTIRTLEAIGIELVRNNPYTLNLDSDRVTGPATDISTVFKFTPGNSAGSWHPMETKYWNFQVELPPLQVWPQKMREGQVGQPYGSLLVNAQGLSSGPFTYEIRGLPTGLVARDNVISGVPAAAGSFNVAIKVTDANNYTATIRKTITVKSQPTITVDYRGGSSVPDARYGESYSAQFDAGGGTPQYVYSVANGVLPDGLSLDSATGKITGVAEKAGEFRFDMVATDKDGYSGKRSTLINVPQPEIVINPTDLPAGKVGLTYEATQLVAEGGLAPYTYKKSAHTSPPPGLAVNATTGVLSGKPTTAGTYSFWLGATDKHGYGGVESGTYGWRYYTVTIEEAPTISVDVANLADGKQNLDYGTHTVTASGGAAPYTYAIEGLPAGLKADGNTVSGTPTVAGSFPITINVKDQDGYEKPFTKTLEIKKAPTITVSHRGSSSVPDTTYAKNYSEQFDADGGTSPYVFSVANGVLPDGLSLDSATGEITGVAKKPGDFRFDLVATDKEGYSGKRNTLISVSKPTIIVSPTTLPAGKERLAYGSHQISASGGIEPYTYEIKGLPAGLTGEGDTISGAPTEAGSFDITINVKDSNGYEQPVTKTLEIKSAPTITIDTTDLAAGKQNLDYGSHTVTASGGAAPYTYAIEGLPAGLKADGNTISGTPTEAGSFSITINVKDHDGYEQPFTKTLEVEPAPTIVVDAEGFHRAYKNVDYVPITVTASGGTPPYSYEFTGLPQGLTGDKNTGTVSGRTSYVGSVLVYIKVTDAKGYTSPATAKFGVWNVPTLADIPDGKQNLDYGTYTITATGGPGGYSYQIENLPEGLTARGNVISGTPAVAGSFDVPVKVTDKEGNTLTFNKAIAISPAPTISIDVTDLPAGKQNLDYGTHTVTASGGAAPYTYAIEGLPARLKADGNTISGTPTEAGSFPITINVKDHDGYEQPFTKTLEVNKAPTITIDTTDLSVGNQNLDYGSHTVAASGGAAPYTYAIKGLPAGLKADGNTVSGTPTEAGSFSITINVKDHDGYEQPFTKTLEVKKAPTITIDTTDLTAGKQNLDYGSHTVAASGGAAPYTYAIKGLPAGLKADGNTISGTPTEVGSFSITINVKDHDGYEQPFTKTLEVKSAPTITIDTSDLTAGKQNLDY
ncbi:putative Ig domain-containing protein, partial [Achromobacter xylosoxidans]|uniref:putative Ig domain-containing protein n=1 Tax=Alcaligenes xylosoxydans xylosoxydans TaxID=85698 RepID=UPI00192BB7B2